MRVCFDEAWHCSAIVEDEIGFGLAGGEMLGVGRFSIAADESNFLCIENDVGVFDWGVGNAVDELADAQPDGALAPAVSDFGEFDEAGIAGGVIRLH